MSEEDTTLNLPSFEQRILAELEIISSRLAKVEMRAGQTDFETKPNWERLHKDIAHIHSAFVQLNADMKVSFGNLDRKLDVINKEMFQVKADQAGLDARLNKIELENPQIILQNQHF